MKNEDADQESETNVPFPPECLIQLLRLYVDEFGGLLAELKYSLASGGRGVDREPVAVMRDLDNAVGLLRDFHARLEALCEEPDWDARVCGIATENGGFCAITFYARDDMRGLRRRASRNEQPAKDHFRAISWMIKGLKNEQPPPRCVVCSKEADEPKWLDLIMVLEGYGENPELIVAGGICTHCGTKHQPEAALRDAVVKAYRVRLQVDLHLLPSAPVPPGRAH